MKLEQEKKECLDIIKAHYTKNRGTYALYYFDSCIIQEVKKALSIKGLGNSLFMLSDEVLKAKLKAKILAYFEVPSTQYDTTLNSLNKNVHSFFKDKIECVALDMAIIKNSGAKHDC